ncbi:hypothetical protein [Streptacidiphilus sp. EB129]|uniref:hypothetical protein n=1 Tax=Streptacidiphilus sp. EB129 TaxID=3156262 RepID=UPI003518C2B2
MARGHGRILTSIWEDADFLMLSQEQQRLYLFLISQPNLNHAGLLPLTLKRWARKAAGLSASDLEKTLAELNAGRFIVLDDDTEELLIRSFVRNDGVWKQPKVMGAMVSGAMEISSMLLRRALLEEMNRIPLDELSDEPTKRGNVKFPSIRDQVAGHIESLRSAFRGTDPTPPAGASEGPSGTPSVPPSESPSDTPIEGGREASTRVTAGAHDARGPLPLSPAPTPVPCPEPPPSSSQPSPAAAETEPSAQPGGGDEAQPDNDAAAFLEALPKPWTLGPVTARALASALIAAARSRRWQLDADLAAKLTENPGGITNYSSVLRKRIDDLPYRLHTVASTSTAKACTACGNDGRTLTDTGICLPCSRGEGQRAPRPDSLRKTNPKTA